MTYGKPEVPQALKIPPPMPAAHPTALRFRRLLLTGAAGGLGRELRAAPEGLLRHAAPVATSRRWAAPRRARNCRSWRCRTRAAVHALLQDVDAVVHLGGVSVEGPFEPILQANIVGMHNLYEAARKHGVKRIVFASSNHVTGFYRQDEVIDARMPMRPDGHYGLSKAFGENLAQFYFDRYGLETVSLRIGSSFPEPKDRRMLATWLSYDDLERLVVSSLTAPVVGHTRHLRPVGQHRHAGGTTRRRAHIGYRPQDSSEAVPRRGRSAPGAAGHARTR